MIKRVRERVQSLPTGARYLISFMAGAVLNVIFFAIAIGIYTLSGGSSIRMTELFLALYPVFLCFISGLLEEDLKGTVLSCIGASAILMVPFCMDDLWSVSAIIVCIFSLHGVCLYYGRNPGFKAAALRCLCLIPTFGEAFFDWNGKPWFYMLLVFALGVLGYIVSGKKHSFTSEGLATPFFMIVAVAGIYASPLSYVLFMLFNPYYYP